MTLLKFALIIAFIFGFSVAKASPQEPAWIFPVIASFLALVIITAALLSKPV